MTDIDTAALRALADEHGAAYDLYIGAGVVAVPTDTVRALCDGYDEAARLRDEVEFLAPFVEANDELGQALVEARQALADLVADLRALPRVRYDECGHRDAVDWPHLRAVIDRHAPESPEGADLSIPDPSQGDLDTSVRVVPGPGIHPLDDLIDRHAPEEGR